MKNEFLRKGNLKKSKRYSVSCLSIYIVVFAFLLNHRSKYMEEVK